MPPKRKITNDSTTPSVSGSDISEPETPSTNRTRTRGRDAVNPQSSPALNTRRSSRLSAAAEEPAKPRARLTRGLRRESDAAALPAPTRGRGRGRGRGRPRGSGRGRRGAAAGAGRGRGRPRAGDSDAHSETESDAGSVSSPDAEEADAYAMLDKSESDGEDSGQQAEDPVSRREESSDENIELSDAHSEKGSANPRDAAGEDSDVEPVVKKRRGPKPAAEQAARAENSSEEDEGGEEPELDGFSDLSDGEGGLGLMPTTNLTRRQRAKLNREAGEELMELPVEAKRSRFSAEEAALRKSEHARRRKFQSLQRAEQLKNDTINRLLNKQTSKGRNRVAEDADTRANSVESSADPDMIRYIQRRAEKSVSESETGSGDAVHIECALLLPNGTAVSDLFPAATAKGSTPAYPKPTPVCDVAGCEMTKKYNVESQAACSLEHWRMLKESLGSAAKLA